MRKIIWTLIILLIVFSPMIVMAEQPQQSQPQQQPKNYEALIAEDGRSRCESSFAVVLRQVDELKAKNQKLEAQLAELQKPKEPKEEKK